MRDHSDMASGLNQSLQGRVALERGWAKLAHELNSMGPPVKDISRWKQAWRDMRNNVKKKAAFNQAEYRGYGPGSTGNGPSKLLELNSTEHQVLEVLGPVAVFGMEEVAATEASNIEEEVVKVAQPPQPDQQPSQPGEQPPQPGEQPPQPGVRKRKRQRSLPIIDNFDAKLLKVEEKKIKIEEERNTIFSSGAGKTTLLVSLAGKCKLPSEGEVVINGRNVKGVDAAELVPQFEAYIDSLSVKEHLVFMTEMKLGSSKKHSNKVFLEELLWELKLNSIANTPISSISGGEKRLLTLATSLLSNPQILICDEPTTGLDSNNAVAVTAVLKKLTESGKTVVCSVHQPSYAVFREFSSILLMANGELVFHGTQDQCKDVFESIGLHCPVNYNPAEFYIRAVSDQKQNIVEKIVETYHDRLGQRTETGSDALGQFKSFRTQRNWFVQVYLIIWRLSLTIKRDIKEHVIQLFLSVMASALILGTCYMGITGTTQRGVQDIRGFLWLITSEVCFAISYRALYVFEVEIPLFRREVGMLYSCSAYVVARFLSFIPRCIIWPITLVTLSTFAVELPNHILTSMEFMLALMMSAVAALAYGLAMSALFTARGNIDAMPCVDLPLFLMSGGFLRISTLPLWLYPVKFISHFYYAMDAVSNIYWQQIDHIDCPWNSTTICVKDGVSVLIENGYHSSGFVYHDGLGLAMVTVIWGLLGYLGLKREERKGYAF